MTAAAARQEPAPSRIEGTATCGEVLTSPASGSPCAHWRLRIVEHLTERTQLVHELEPLEGLELEWRPTPSEPPMRVRIDREGLRIDATPVLHREGSASARRVADLYGFAGPILVEEVVVRIGETLVAEGFLDDPRLCSRGPFRGGGRAPEMFDVTLHLPLRPAAPSLLPWALGTAAALLGGIGAGTAAYLARRVETRAPRSCLAPAEVTRALTPARPARPRLP